MILSVENNFDPGVLSIVLALFFLFLFRLLYLLSFLASSSYEEMAGLGLRSSYSLTRKGVGYFPVVPLSRTLSDNGGKGDGGRRIGLV